MGIFRDRAAERAKEASTRRKVQKMRGVSSKVNKGHSIPAAPAPYTCGACCQGYPNGCPSTVRGGVCPCRWC